MSGRVVVGLSGGVDSAVAAYLLQQQGYDVVGIFMRNWFDESVTINNECPWIDDSNDAMLAAEFLGIPFQVLDLSAAYYDRIVRYMFREYESGRTPNPDILCNREIKFDVFLKAALSLQADFVATGHYARKEEGRNAAGDRIWRLLAGVDPNKDQSYFLCQLTQKQLEKVLFPLGALTKPEVRKMARSIGLPNADKKDSQGLCFVGKVKLPVFLQQQLEPKQGLVIEIPDTALPEAMSVPSVLSHEDLVSLATPPHFAPAMGKKVGIHQGSHYYTVGQRKGLGVGGKAEPLFILDTDPVENIVYTGMGDYHRGLYRNALFIPATDIHWIREDLRIAPGEKLACMARIRYRQELSACTLFQFPEGMYLVFAEPQRGVARGQFAAWYCDQEVLGSGVIA